MREWIDELSHYIQTQEKIDPQLGELSEEIHQAALEADFLLQASDQLQTAYSSLKEKVEHVES